MRPNGLELRCGPHGQPGSWRGWLDCGVAASLGAKPLPQLLEPIEGAVTIEARKQEPGKSGQSDDAPIQDHRKRQKFKEHQAHGEESAKGCSTETTHNESSHLSGSRNLTVELNCGPGTGGPPTHRGGLYHWHGPSDHAPGGLGAIVLP